jgi:RHS repeat-associated protein
MITTYTYDRANRLTLSNAGGTLTTYTVDAAGNRTLQQSPGDSTYLDWDAVGRLSSVEVAAGTVTLTYNADGQRTAKQSTDGSVTGFLYDYKKLLAETDDVGGEVSNLYATTTDQEFGDLISEDGDQLVHQYDAQACTNALLDSSGNLEATFKYYAFGQLAWSSIQGDAYASLSVDQWAALTVEQWAALPVEIASAMTSMGAMGQKQYYLDLETQLYLLGTGTNGRYYDAAAGRFISEDPVRQAGGEDNLLLYVHNDPVNRLDPSGHDDDKKKRTDPPKPPPVNPPKEDSQKPANNTAATKPSNSSASSPGDPQGKTPGPASAVVSPAPNPLQAAGNIAVPTDGGKGANVPAPTAAPNSPVAVTGGTAVVPPAASPNQQMQNVNPLDPLGGLRSTFGQQTDNSSAQPLRGSGGQPVMLTDANDGTATDAPSLLGSLLSGDSVDQITATANAATSLGNAVATGAGVAGGQIQANLGNMNAGDPLSSDFLPNVITQGGGAILSGVASGFNAAGQVEGQQGNVAAATLLNAAGQINQMAAGMVDLPDTMANLALNAGAVDQRVQNATGSSSLADLAGIGYFAGSFVGATPMLEGAMNQNFATGQQLGLNQGGVFFGGVAGMAFAGAGAASLTGVNPTLGGSSLSTGLSMTTGLPGDLSGNLSEGFSAGEPLGPPVDVPPAKPPAPPPESTPGKTPGNAGQTSKTAAENALPTSESQLGHIFRDAEGHLPNTPENQQLLQDVANDAKSTLGTDKYGTTWSGRTLPDGTQVWTQTRNGQIVNGGLNQTPKVFNPETGLSSPTKPGG